MGPRVTRSSARGKIESGAENDISAPSLKAASKPTPKKRKAPLKGQKISMKSSFISKTKHKEPNKASRLTGFDKVSKSKGGLPAASKAHTEDKPLRITSSVPIPVKAECPSQGEDSVSEEIYGQADNRESKPMPKKAKYGLTPGGSPFPNFKRPTPEECEEANRLLSSVHGEVIAPDVVPEPSLTVTGCGEVPSVLDALIRTLLSSATSSSNSANAFKGLVARFGILKEGIGKGSVDWDAVRQAPLKDVFNAIKSGGLADSKSKNIKAILDMVYEENQNRRNLLLEEGDDASSYDKAIVSTEKAIKDEQYEINCADQHILSLNHIHNLSTENAMNEMTKYPGIGPKTAACVILFCLQRPCFAVDTHIFRICKWLGWLPATGVGEITAFSHLDVRIPDHLKYSLHQLLIRHGKQCVRCKANTSESAPGWEDGCVIDHLVIRSKTRDAKQVIEGSPKRVVKRKAETPKKTAVSVGGSVMVNPAKFEIAQAAGLIKTPRKGKAMTSTGSRNARARNTVT